MLLLFLHSPPLSFPSLPSPPVLSHPTYLLPSLFYPLLSSPPLPSQTGEHLIQSVHSETQRMEREYWDAIEEFISPPKPTEGEEVAKISSDTYCFELMSMIIGLCRSEPGCQFLASSDCLVQDLFTLLHVASMRVQLQVKDCFLQNNRSACLLYMCPRRLHN